MMDEDLPVILGMERELFPENPWPEDQYHYELHENPFAQVFILEKDGRTAGYADLWILYDQAQIANIGVSKEFQRQGCGQELLQHCIREAVRLNCENITLEVRIDNTPAITLYEKNDFINAAVRRNYYEDGTDAYLMIKPLGGLEYDDNTGN